ncbi:unnamed protein product [Closterium sp. NIES-65]|nr:unnamed protein product [Closterium sp. NIES-65]
MAAAPQHVDGVHPPAPGSGDRDVDHTQSSIPAVGSAEGVVPGLPVASSDGNGILAGNVNGDGGLGTDGGMDGGGGTTGLEDQTTGGDQSVATPMTERKREKQMEVFVGGLDKDASEEDVKRVFGRVGQIAHVRLPRDSATGRNKGYCFVQYATEGAARRAASELDRILVRGRPVGVLGGEQEDTLFIGNINKTWSKAKIEAVLAGAGVGAWEALTFMEDPQHAGHNRGFAFLEFASHRAAAAAKQRLQQADVSLGVDRPPRVSWAAPLNEPDQRVMAQVKSIFVDGMPPSWDEPRAAGFFGRYGQIERVVLARNLPSAKRQDYGFINYTTREAALAAIAALNGSQVVDGNFQMKMRVTLAKPQDRKPRHPPPGGRAGGGEQRRADFGDGSVTALLEALREQAEREERGEGAQGAQAGEGEGAGAEVKTEGGGDGSSGVGTGKGVKQEGGGVGEQEGGLAGSAAAAVEAALANESKGAGDGEGDAEGEAEEGAEGEAGTPGKARAGEREGKNTAGLNRFECAVCVFGSDDESEYLSHQLSRVHSIVSMFRQDLKLSNKTPLSMLNELAMRNKIEVTYELKGEPTGPFDASASLGGGPNAIPWVCGEARAGMKLRAKQMAAAAALEALLQAGVGESELTRPGQARLKQMGKGKGGRGSPGGAQRGGRGAYGGRGGGDRGRADRDGGGYGGWASGDLAGGVGGYGSLGVYGGGAIGTGLGEAAAGESYAERLGRIQGMHYVMRSGLPPASPSLQPLAPPAAPPLGAGLGAAAGGYGAPSTGYAGSGAAYGGQYGGAQYSAVQQYGGKYGGASYGGSPYGGAQYGGAAYEGQYGRAEGAASGGKRPYPPADNPDGLHASQRPRTDPYAPAAPPTRSAYSNPPPAHPYSAPPPPHPYSTPPAHPYTNPPPTHPPPSNPPSSYPSAHTYPAPPSYPPSYSYPPAPSAPYGTGGASSAPAAPPPPAPPPYYQQQHPQSQQAAGAGSGSSAGGAERLSRHRLLASPLLLRVVRAVAGGQRVQAVRRGRVRTGSMRRCPPPTTDRRSAPLLTCSHATAADTCVSSTGQEPVRASPARTLNPLRN